MKNKIKTFQFPISNSNGGISKYAVNNWYFLDKNKFECDFGTVSKHLDYEQEIINSGARVKYISCYAEDNKEQFEKEFYELFSKEKYDVVHLHTTSWKSFLVEEIAVKCNIPKIIVHAHNTSVEGITKEERESREKIHNLKKQEFNTSLATDFLACSSDAADWLFGNQIPQSKIKIIKNAIDVDKFIFNKDIRKKIREQLNVENNFVVGHIGNFVWQKNHEFLINVFAKACKKEKRLKLILVGDGNLYSKVQQQVEKLDINDNVIFTGSRADVNYLLQAMDLYCFPSVSEGLGISIIEAQASGLKCLVSDKIPNEILITNNINALSLDEEKWINKILELSNDYERLDMYNEITKAGYNIKEQIKEIENLYSNHRKEL